MTIQLIEMSFALISAFLFALGVQFQNIGLSSITARQGTAISISSAALMYWILAPFYLDISNFTKPTILIFILIGIFRPSLSANLAVAGTRFLGPTLSTTLSSTTPLFAGIMGVLWLGENLTWQLIIGTAGVLSATFALSLNAGVSINWPIWALILPIGAALIRSLAHFLTKIGMTDIPDPYFAGLISFSISSVITITLLKLNRKITPITWKSRGVMWFILSGIIMGTAIISLNTALMHGNLTLVIPIVAISPIFTMLLSIIIFKKEIINARIIFALLIVVPSIICIALTH